MAFGCTVVSPVTRVLAAERAGLVRHPQAIGQQLLAESLAPVAQIQALARECVLEELNQV
ncbi:hypothetical protein Bra1253DRAFT_01719 [Bradyrhizobium sp. WSM1253]|nr:hypothetical protein Bra1253DRAFT_01719 [Bradyrhizobium sp. WSM1253]